MSFSKERTKTAKFPTVQVHQRLDQDSTSGQFEFCTGILTGKCPLLGCAHKRPSKRWSLALTDRSVSLQRDGQ